MNLSTEQKTDRVLIVGCGDIGSRHLQAAAALAEVSEIEVMDVRAESLQRGKERLRDLPETRQGKSYRWIQRVKDASREGGVCVVATQAEGRAALVRELVENLGYRSFLLEKVVTQSLKEYDALMELAEHYQLRIWVNCKTRAYPFHERAIQKFDPYDRIDFTVVSGNHGLATNGLHSVDLFTYYDGCSTLSAGHVEIDPVLHVSKRGGSLFDLSGVVEASSDKGSRLSLLFAGDHTATDVYHVSSRRYRFMVDHSNRWAFEADAESGWAWRPVPFEGNLLISQMSQGFVRDILTHGHCELPTLSECRLAHAFVLETLQPHFNRLMGKTLDHCPIT